MMKQLGQVYVTAGRAAHMRKQFGSEDRECKMAPFLIWYERRHPSNGFMQMFIILTILQSHFLDQDGTTSFKAPLCHILLHCRKLASIWITRRQSKVYGSRVLKLWHHKRSMGRFFKSLYLLYNGLNVYRSKPVDFNSKVGPITRPRICTRHAKTSRPKICNLIHFTVWKKNQFPSTLYSRW